MDDQPPACVRYVSVPNEKRETSSTCRAPLVRSLEPHSIFNACSSACSQIPLSPETRHSNSSPRRAADLSLKRFDGLVIESRKSVTKVLVRVMEVYRVAGVFPPAGEPMWRLASSDGLDEVVVRRRGLALLRVKGRAVVLLREHEQAKKRVGRARHQLEPDHLLVTLTYVRGC